MWFYVFYLAAGFTDMVDGMVARKTDTVSEFGSNLDTFADFIFVFVCLIKFVPLINFPLWVYMWVIIILFIKLGTIVLGYFTKKRFVSIHTFMNKLTGLFLFIWPLTWDIVELKYSVIVVCVIATFAAIQEFYYIKIADVGQ